MSESAQTGRGDHLRSTLLQRRWGYALAQLSLSVVWCGLTVGRQAGADLLTYLSAARAWAATGNPYVPGYLYPPQLAWLLSSVRAWKALPLAWSGLQALCFCGFFAATTELARLNGTLAGVAAFVLLFLAPFRQLIALGNVEALVTCSVTLAGLLLYRRRPLGGAVSWQMRGEAIAAGAMLACAALLKVTPGWAAIFVCWRALKSDPKSRLAAVVLLLVLLGASAVGGTELFFRRALLEDSLAAQRYLSDSNVSLLGYLWGIGVRLPGWVLLVLAAFPTALMLRQEALQGCGERGLGNWMLVLCLTIFVSPITWTCGYFRLIAPLGWVAGRLLAGQRLFKAQARGRQAEALLLALFFVVVINAGHFRAFEHVVTRAVTPLIPVLLPPLLFAMVWRLALALPETTMTPKG